MPDAPVHLTVLTGGSRGLGAALARGLLEAGHRLLTLQRRPEGSLQAGGGPIEQWSVDLADPLPVATRLGEWLARFGAGEGLASFTLIHNAALLTEPGPLSHADLAQLSRATRVSLEAPLLLTAAALAATHRWTVPRKVLLVSSGLGRRGMAGAAAYCAAKAGLDNLARALALEEAEHPNGARVVSLAPGVIDTDMQVQLRGADARQFTEQATFARLKAGGALDSPEAAAAKVLRFLARPDYGSEPIGDVRQA